MLVSQGTQNNELSVFTAVQGVYIDPAVRYSHDFRLDCTECLWTAKTNDMIILAARNNSRKLRCPHCGQWTVNISVTR